MLETHIERRSGRARARLLPALALLVGLFAAAPGEAQTLQLTGLTLSAGGSTVTLSPSFDSGTTSYTATVPHDATSVRVTPSWTATTPWDIAVSVGSIDPSDGRALGYPVTIATSGGGYSVDLASSGNTNVWASISSDSLDTGTTYNVVVSRPPTVTLSALPNPVTEGESVTVTARLSAAATSAVSVPVTVSTASPNTAESSDVGTLTAISIASGQTTGAGTITTAQDPGDNDETFTVALGTLPSLLTAGSPPSVTVRIRDNEAERTLTLSASPNPVTEGKTVTVTALLSKAAASAASIPVRTRRVTSEMGDHDFLTSISIAGGQTTGTGTITTYQDDGDNDETFTVELRTLTEELTEEGFAAGSPSSVTVTIQDDPMAPALWTDLRVTPGDGQLTVTWTVPPGLTRFDIRGYHVEYRESVCTKLKLVDFGTPDKPDLVPVTQDGVPAYVHCDPSNPDQPGPWIPHGGWAGSWDPIARQTSRVIDGLIPSVDYDVRVRAQTNSTGKPYLPYVLATGTPSGGDSDARLRRMKIQ